MICRFINDSGILFFNEQCVQKNWFDGFLWDAWVGGLVFLLIAFIYYSIKRKKGGVFE